MAEYVKGQLKDKLGNILHPETGFGQVLDTDGKNLSTWRTEIEAVVPTQVQKSYLENAGQANGVLVLNANGIIDLDKLPPTLNKFKGSFATSEALPAEGEAGDYAIANDTDTVWVWDAEKADAPGWIDTGKKGAVTSVNGQTGDVSITLENLGLTVDAATINGLPAAVEAAQSTADQGVAAAAAAQTTADQGVADAATAQAAAEAAQTTATEVDFAVIEAGATAPDTLREGGMYFEKAAAATV